MEAPDGGKELKPFNAPAWLLKAAKEAAARTAPRVLEQSLQQAKKSGEATKDAAVLALRKKLVEARAEQSVSSFNIVEQPKPTLEAENAALPRDKEATEQVKEVCRTLQVDKREERRAKKKQVRTKQNISGKSDTTSPADVATPTSTEKREATAATADHMSTTFSRSLFVPETSEDRYSIRPVLPQWYTAITENAFRMKELGKKRPQSLTSLEALKACIVRCEAEKKPRQLTMLYEELRNHVHKAEITLHVDKFILKKAKILSAETGLPRIFREDAEYPGDLKADAYQLYNRWYNGDFEQDILRGIITIKGKDRNGDQIDPAYRTKHPASAKTYGEKDLVLGQWWPTQLCTVRDGAHGAAQGGIYGETGKGAYSIVVSGGGGYHDQDNGDTIEYSGTEGKEFKPTENTLHMIQSAKLNNPIRVIRSSQLPKKNTFRPLVGLRYDGLYTVKSYTLVDPEKQMYKFLLERCARQEPIRCADNAARRPTLFEIEEYDRLKAKGSWL